MTDERKIEYFPLSELLTRLHPQNAKDHDITAIVASYKAHGYVASGVIDNRTGRFLAGHGRVMALRDMKLHKQSPPRGIRNGGDDWLVPVQVGYESDNDIQALAYLAADNKLTELGGWDEAALADLLQEIANSDEIDLGATGFSGDELDELLADLAGNIEPAPDPGAQIDKAAELQKKWGVVCGQIWWLGKHRIMCADSSDVDNIDKITGGVKSSLCLTDPPYGIKMDKGFEGFGGFGPPIARRQYNDEWDGDRPTQDTLLFLVNISKKTIIFGGNFFADLLPMGGHWLVWDKNNTMPTFGDCELAWTNLDRKSVKKYEYTYNGLIGKEKERFHPTQKPVGLFTMILNDYSDPGDIIIDPYLGSGTTLIACEMSKRTCFGLEMSPDYCAVILQRWADLTGQSPVLVSAYGGDQ